MVSTDLSAVTRNSSLAHTFRWVWRCILLLFCLCTASGLMMGMNFRKDVKLIQEQGKRLKPSDLEALFEEGRSRVLAFDDGKTLFLKTGKNESLQMTRVEKSAAIDYGYTDKDDSNRLKYLEISKKLPVYKVVDDSSEQLYYFDTIERQGISHHIFRPVTGSGSDDGKYIYKAPAFKLGISQAGFSGKMSTTYYDDQGQIQLGLVVHFENGVPVQLEDPGNSSPLAKSSEKDYLRRSIVFYDGLRVGVKNGRKRFSFLSKSDLGTGNSKIYHLSSDEGPKALSFDIPQLHYHRIAGNELTPKEMEAVLDIYTKKSGYSGILPDFFENHIGLDYRLSAYKEVSKEVIQNLLEEVPSYKRVMKEKFNTPFLWRLLAFFVSWGCSLEDYCPERIPGETEEQFKKKIADGSYLSWLAYKSKGMNMLGGEVVQELFGAKLGLWEALRYFSDHTSRDKIQNQGVAKRKTEEMLRAWAGPAGLRLFLTFAFVFLLCYIMYHSLVVPFLFGRVALPKRLATPSRTNVFSGASDWLIWAWEWVKWCIAFGYWMPKPTPYLVKCKEAEDVKPLFDEASDMFPLLGLAEEILAAVRDKTLLPPNHLLAGPGGTGKTRLVQYTIALLERRNKSIGIVQAPSLSDAELGDLLAWLKERERKQQYTIVVFGEVDNILLSNSPNAQAFKEAYDVREGAYTMFFALTNRSMDEFQEQAKQRFYGVELSNPDDNILLEILLKEITHQFNARDAYSKFSGVVEDLKGIAKVKKEEDKLFKESKRFSLTGRDMHDLVAETLRELMAIHRKGEKAIDKDTCEKAFEKALNEKFKQKDNEKNQKGTYQKQLDEDNKADSRIRGIKKAAIDDAFSTAYEKKMKELKEEKQANQELISGENASASAPATEVNSQAPAAQSPLHLLMLLILLLMVLGMGGTQAYLLYRIFRAKK